MIFKNHFNHRDVKSPGEKNTQPSQTVPDQAMTVQEIMDRFARGLPVSGIKVPIYNGEMQLPDLDKMDLADIQEYRETVAEQIESTKQKLQQQNDYKKQQSKKQAKEATASTAEPLSDTGTNE